jgi:hypothetical protein
VARAGCGHADWRCATALSLALAVLAGCTSSQEGGDSASPDAGIAQSEGTDGSEPSVDAAPAALTELTSLEDYFEHEAGYDTLGQQLSAALDDDGTLPLQASLDLYAAIIGPIPGGDANRFTLEHRASGTTALRRLLHHLDELDADQRAVVDDLLARDDVQILASGREGEVVRVVDVDGYRDEVSRLVVEMRDRIAGRLGRSLGLPIVLSLLDRDESPDLGDVDPDDHGGTGWAVPEAGGRTITSGRPDGCLIGIFPNDGHNLRTVVAHEVFHCFQFALADDVAHVMYGQDWIIEGQASWAEADLLGPASDTARLYDEWLCTSPALTSRSYDAIGFYATLEALHVSPWRVFEDMLGLEGADAVAATGVEVETMLRRIATSRYRDDPSASRFGPDWRFTADGATGRRDCVVHLTVGASGRGVDHRLGPLTASPPIEITGEGDVLVYELAAPIGAHEFANGGRTGIWTTATRGMQCLLVSCPCPDGRPAVEGNGDQQPLVTAFASRAAGEFRGKFHTIPLDEACGWEVDAVTIEIHGLLEQTLVGGACYVEEGYLHVHAGWNSSNGSDQGPPHPDANGLIVTLAQEGTSPIGHPTLMVWGAQSGSILYRSPSTVRDAGLLTGTFSGDGVHGRWSCPQVVVSDRPVSADLEEERRRILEGG